MCEEVCEQARAIRSTFRKCDLQNHSVISFASRNLTSFLQPKKGNLCNKTNCAFCEAGNGTDCWSKELVYKIQCVHCNSFYIGETKRSMRSRLREHISTASSLVYQHLKTHSSHTSMSDIRWAVLHSSLQNWRLRCQVEMSEIRSQRPDIKFISGR